MCLSQATISIPTSFVCDSVCVCVYVRAIWYNVFHIAASNHLCSEKSVVMLYYFTQCFVLMAKKKLYYVYIYIVETLVPTAFCLMFLYKYVTHINTHSWSKNE